MPNDSKPLLARPRLIAGIVFFVIFAVFLISAAIVPESRGGWHNPPLFDFLFIIGSGICFAVICGIDCIASWSHGAVDFTAWLRAQNLLAPLAVRSFFHYSDSYYLWLFRLISPIGFLMGLALAGFGLFAALTYFLR